MINTVGASPPAISQDLLTTVSAGETLSVTFWGGNGANVLTGSNGGGVVTATFLVGSTPYSANFDTTTAPSGGWKQFTLTEPITNSGDLSLQFDVASGKPWLDNISAVAEAVPEPTSLVFVGVGAVGLLWARRRRVS